MRLTQGMRIPIESNLYKSGTKWLDVASWVKTVNKSSVSFNNTKYSIGSGIYRVKTTADVYSGSKYETVTAVSYTHLTLPTTSRV